MRYSAGERREDDLPKWAKDLPLPEPYWLNAGVYGWYINTKPISDGWGCVLGCRGGMLYKGNGYGGFDHRQDGTPLDENDPAGQVMALLAAWRLEI